MFLRGCLDHRDQLFCLFELKKLPGLTDRVSVGKYFAMAGDYFHVVSRVEKSTTKAPAFEALQPKSCQTFFNP